MESKKIAVIKGDGTGPEVIHEALKVLNVVNKKYNLNLIFEDIPCNGERYLKSGITITNEEVEALKTDFSAILLGAIGHPDVKPGILERDILLRLRFDLDLYINLRPVRLYPNVHTPVHFESKPNYAVVRENSGGLYTGFGGQSMKNTIHEVSSQSMVYSYHQVERCLRYAFELVRKRHQSKPWEGLSDEEKKKGYIGRLTLCGKSNVLTYVFDLWLKVMKKLSKETFADVSIDYVHVDAVCIHMIERPEIFDVIVTTNMFGDIITDLAAVTQGGMGVAASGNINPNGTSMFEPIGGTAPNFTGQNCINPIAAIGASHMMLEHLGFSDVAQTIQDAKIKTIGELKSMQAGKMGFSTSEVGDKVVSYLD